MAALLAPCGWVAGALVLAAAITAGPAHAAGDDELFFEIRVRPILVARCGSCHIDKARGGLALTTRAALLAGGESGPSFDGAHPARSLLLRTIRHEEDGLEMPFNEDKMPAAEIAVLEDWFARGAPWPQALPGAGSKPAGLTVSAADRRHWAFLPLAAPKPPALANLTVAPHDFVRNDIDRFVLARLQDAGLEPAGKADRATLIRRMTFDLTGLPPTPQEVQAFVDDDAPDAIARLADRLLNSPAYGERWARHFMDVVHYGEAGLDGDTQEETEYAHAFRYRDWLIGAFNADLPYDRFVLAHLAGDLLPEPNLTAAATGWAALGPHMSRSPKGRAEQLADRVDTVTRGFLGLTVACARCHDHKYDAITSADYYALAGVFHNTAYDERSLGDEARTRAHEEHRTKLAALERQMKELLRKRRAVLIDEHAESTARHVLAAFEVAGPQRARLADAAGRHDVDPALVKGWVTLLSGDHREYGFLDGFASLRERTMAQAFAARTQALVTGVLQEKRQVEAETAAKLAAACGTRTRREKFAQNSEEPSCARTVAVAAMAPDRKLFYLDIFEDTRDFSNEGFGTRDGVFAFDDREVEAKLSQAERQALLALRAQRDHLRMNAPPAPDYIHSLTERDREEPDLRIHVRGNPEVLGARVPRRFLTVLSDGAPVPFQTGSGRLELAQAIVNHPLASRVIVNRVWAHHMGSGLCATPDNFGVMGARPSHPELLDFLASYLVDKRFSLKALHRLILTSRTYSLASWFDPARFRAHLERDPDATLLWRAHRRRLDVEEIRDALLEASGQLDRTLGGPSFSDLDGSTRRTLYVKVNRVRNNPYLSLFDFPDPALSVAARQRTSVPSQGLYFLNSGFVDATARALAERVAAQSSAADPALASLALALLARTPTADELSLLRAHVGLWPRGDRRRRVQALTSVARALVATGDFLFVD